MKYSRQTFAHLFVTACLAPKFFATAQSDYPAAPGGSCENGNFENHLLSVSSSELDPSVNETLTEMKMQQTKSTGSKSLRVASYSYVLGPNQDPDNIKNLIKSFLFSTDIVANVFEEEENNDDIFGIDLPGVSFESLPFGPFEFAYFLERTFQLEAAEPVLAFVDTLDVAEDEEQGEEDAAKFCEELADVIEVENICNDPKNKEWHLKHVKAPEAWDFSEKEGKPSRGKDIVIAQIDTGYSHHYGAFPPDDDMWIDKNKKGLNMYYRKNKKGRLDPKDEIKSFGLAPAHGTVVAPHAVGRGTVEMKNKGGGDAPKGTAPKAKLYSVRAVNNPVIDPRDAGRVVDAIEEIVRMNVKVDVISMSLGASSLGTRQKRAREAIESAIANNIIVVAAGGQLASFTRSLPVVYPARYDDVIAVGGYQVADRSGGSTLLHDRTMEWWPQAFEGKEIDIAGPANHVCNAKVNKSGWFKKKLSYDYATGFGTSLATAMTGGIAALWVAHHGKDNLIKHFHESDGITLQAAFKKVLELTANKKNWKDCKDKDITKGCYKRRHGHGMIDAEAILKKSLTEIRNAVLNIEPKETSEEGAAQNNAKSILLEIGYDEDELKLVFQEDDLEHFYTELVYIKSKDNAAMSSKLRAKLGPVKVRRRSRNVALGKVTAQSSDYKDTENNISKYAVDGDISPESTAGHENNLTHTGPGDSSPFWHVLLGSLFVIDSVVIHNRDHPCPNSVGGNCSSRLRGFRMEILKVVDGNESVVHIYDDPSSTDPGLVIRPNIPSGVVGNKVRISIPDSNEYLHLREVQVFSSTASE